MVSVVCQISFIYSTTLPKPFVALSREKHSIFTRQTKGGIHYPQMDTNRDIVLGGSVH